MKRYSKEIYIIITAIAVVSLFGSYIPGLQFLGKWCTPPVMLFLGLAYALLCGQGYPSINKKMSKVLLQYSVVGLGFGMNLYESLASGRDGMLFTIVSVVGTLVIGMLIGRKLLKVDKETSYLISSGTAICGGSAIAAVGPVIKAKPENMSVALATSFIFKSKDRKITIPWFILYFVIAILLNTFILDSVPEFGKVISGLARKCLTLTMFFIGASLSTDVLRSVGIKPLILGILLWVVISVGSLLFIIL